MTTAQTILAVMALVNVYIIFALTQLAGWKKDVERRLSELEGCKMTDERFRVIIREELQGFELRLIKEGRLEAT